MALWMPLGVSMLVSAKLLGPRLQCCMLRASARAGLPTLILHASEPLALWLGPSGSDAARRADDASESYAQARQQSPPDLRSQR
eukprot:CAMPEP_0115873342 /NCGR_PEP_ID=MMETSP0287-20121206/23943_1 /TAXON_ID=412157 /ORGANISM="Chrysochromulina rotalis, Strain UIO044" /LENGTH=83 /DNA_ID=CAMNT_0003328393 /DNA_START=166 /DNA_END=417 /DNA_ORIENTATION=-